MIFTPEPHQNLMIDHLRSRDRGAAFMGVGLGKTAATLEALNQDFQDGACKGALVVAPLRVARMTWPNELQKWSQFGWMRVEHVIDRPPSGWAHIYLINYERLRRINNFDFCDTVIFDELTRAKNHQSERIKWIRHILQRSPHVRRWGLTGTPRPNSLLELFGQIRLLDDGARLGPSWSQFRSTYFEPIDFNEYNWRPKSGAEEQIYQKIHDLVITLRSSDYLSVPDTIVEDVEVKLPEEAHGVYKELERELLVSFEAASLETIVAANAAVLVGKLLQVASGTVYSEMRGVVQVHGAKIAALKRLLVDLGEERALIATNFIHERERVVAAIPGAVDGSKFKGDIEDAWNSGSIRYLVADPRSLGHGLNLQKGGRNVIWFSPIYSRELYDQFNGRVIRKGQTESPRIFRIVSTGTIDDVVLETLRERDLGQQAMMQLLTNFRLQGRIFI